jgi:hypothetical protein
MALWLGGIAAICREDPFGRAALGAAIALAGAALIGFLS